jgi:hypothetical protein
LFTLPAMMRSFDQAGVDALAACICQSKIGHPTLRAGNSLRMTRTELLPVLVAYSPAIFAGSMGSVRRQRGNCQSR